MNSTTADDNKQGRANAGDLPAGGAPLCVVAPPAAALVDWLEFTLFTTHAPADVLDLLGVAGVGLDTIERGLLGYRCRHVAGTITILTDGAPGMGVHVIVPGGALRAFALDALAILSRLAVLNTAAYTPPLSREYQDTPRLAALMSTIDRPADAAPPVACKRVKITRLDLALDDFAGRLDLPAFAAALTAGAVTSRARQFGIVEGGEIATGEIAGRTYYVGKRGSRAMARLYDKRAEQIAAGQNPADLPEIWNRCEIELRDESAGNAAAVLTGNAALAAGVISPKLAARIAAAMPAARVIRGIVNNFLSVRVPDLADSNKSRWPVAPWWAEFLNTVEKFGVGVALTKPDMPARRKWFDRQCTKAAALLSIGYGRHYLRRAMDDAILRVSEKELTDARIFAAAREDAPAPLPLPPLACPSCGAVHDLRAETSGKTVYRCENCGAVFVTNHRPKLAA